MENEKISGSPSAGFKPSSDETFHPIFALWAFLSRITLKKISTWIVMGVLAVLTVFATIIPSFMFKEVTGDEDTKSAIIATNKIWVQQFIFLPALAVCLGAGMQGILKATNIFIDSQKDGTEILIVSKPITRAQIVIARFSYLFMFDAALSLINMITVILGMAIVGFDYYDNSGTIIGGAFGGSFLSFAIMGMIAALIGLFTDGKVARVLPIAIVSLSSTVGVVFPNVAQTSIKSPLHTLGDKVIKKTSLDVKNENLQFKPSGGDYGQAYKIIGIKSSYDSIFKYDNLYNSIYISGWVELVLENYEYSPQIRVTSSITPTQDQGHGQGSDEEKRISDKISNLLLENVGGESENASAAYIINYINPISAFMTIMGSSSSKISFGNGISPNYNISNVSKRTYQRDILDRGYDEETLKKYNIKYIETSPFDPSWAVGLTWGAIFVLATAGTVYGYLRKDFK